MFENLSNIELEGRLENSRAFLKRLESQQEKEALGLPLNRPMIILDQAIGQVIAYHQRYQKEASVELEKRAKANE